MRSAAVDRRLEAIAGAPRGVYTTFAEVTTPAGATIVAVGALVIPTDKPRQQLLWANNGPEIRINTGQELVSAISGAYLLVPTTSLVLGWAVMPEASSSVRLGALYTALSPWLGAWAAAVYNSTLTSVHAARIARWLAQRYQVMPPPAG